ncbi:hypothetical protein AZ78_1309 [Lysobacter capsici AZ78]|uniref:Uncharacterized protein n=1 Tax=Lysobacter capsici AZ78 TaxID=1444315 RepID=A0A108U731_9GAMM|nr:hypothetical protein [Lysobacter capsici]KWS03760.1 hypothetical protein AZ78_1309 [Lysobacter capsici AZ78]
MSKAASKGALEALHNKLATTLAEALDGLDASEKGTAAILNVARQFLKDNNVEAAPREGQPLGALAEKVAQFPFDPAEDTRAH